MIEAIYFLMNDILIVGGGVIGLSLAREFRKNGVTNITILERGEIGQEASFAAAGMLAPQAEANKADNFFNFCRDSLNMYVDFSEMLLDETGVNIELDKSGTLYAAFNRSDVGEIRKRYLWQLKAGLEVEYLGSNLETRSYEPSISPYAFESLFFPNDWQIENRKLVKALRRYAALNEIKIIKNTEVKNILRKNIKIVGVQTLNNEKYFADTILLTAGAWTSLIKIGEKQFAIPGVKPIKGQMMSFYTSKQFINHVIYSPRGYIVPRKTGKILAGATVENVGFETHTTKKASKLIKENAEEIFPDLANLPIDDEWAGLRPFVADGVPVIGSCAGLKNLFVATAHYRNGILLAPLTAQILADRIISGKKSKYLETFSPDRLRAVKKNVKKA